MFALTLLSGCSSNKAFEDAVRKGNYIKAIEIYREHLYGNANAENAGDAFLENYLQEKLDGYAEGTVEEADFTNAYTTVEEINRRIGTVDGLDKTNGIKQIISASKEIYAKAEEYEKNGDVLKAAEAYRQVSKFDKEHYETAAKKAEELQNVYVSGIRAEAEKLAEEEQFDRAVALLEEGFRQIGENSDLLQLKKDITVEKYETAVRKADEQGNLPGVIRSYALAAEDTSVVLSADMSRLYAAASSGYVDKVKADAAEAFAANKNYSEAMEIIRTAMGEVSEDAEVTQQLQNLLDEYIAYQPVKLKDLGYTHIAEYISEGTRDSEISTDVTGRQFDAAGVLHPTGGLSASDTPQDDSEAEITYYLNGEYSVLNGTVFRPYISLRHPGQWKVNTRAEIYGDGQLLYSAPVLNGDTYESYDFSVDVSGVRQLTILVRGLFRESGAFMGWYEYMPRICVGDLSVQK